MTGRGGAADTRRMRNAASVLLALALAGCAGRTPLVAEYSPERRYQLDPGTWLRNGSIRPTEGGSGHVSDLEEGRIVEVIPGGHDILRFDRRDETVHLRAWVEVDGGRLVSAWMWAREWGGETKWFVGSAGTGTLSVEEREDDAIEGTMDLTFQGRMESPRGGISGPYVFRLTGDFTAKTEGAR